MNLLVKPGKTGLQSEATHCIFMTSTLYSSDLIHKIGKTTKGQVLHKLLLQYHWISIGMNRLKARTEFGPEWKQNCIQPSGSLCPVFCYCRKQCPIILIIKRSNSTLNLIAFLAPTIPTVTVLQKFTDSLKAPNF